MHTKISIPINQICYELIQTETWKIICKKYAYLYTPKYVYFWLFKLLNINFTNIRQDKEVDHYSVLNGSSMQRYFIINVEW